MTARGSSCVKWNKSTDMFPFFDGVSSIVFSWVLSPLVSGIFGSIFFYALRTAVLRSPTSFEKTRWAFPLILGTTVCINIFFIVYKGAKYLNLDDTPIGIAFAYAFGIGGGLALLSYFTVCPYIIKNSQRKFDDQSDPISRTDSTFEILQTFQNLKGESSVKYTII